MSGRSGRTVRLFLVDGSAGGLITAEIINWSGKVLAGPRTRLPELLKREEVSKSGIYLLRGEDPQQPYKPIIYVGEGDSVAERLRLHNKDEAKDFWDHTHLVVSKDENLTKGHVRYLESRLIALIDEAGRATLRNGTKPPPPPLPEPDRADMDFFLDQIQTVLPVLGLDVFRRLVASRQSGAAVGEPPSPTFVIVSKPKGDRFSVRATASLVDGEFVVGQGSTGRKKQGVQNTYAARRGQLVAEGKIVDHPTEPDAVLFAADVAFPSPSAAAAVVLNRNSNGRTEWKVEPTGQTYADWQAQQLPSSSDQGD